MIMPPAKKKLGPGIATIIVAKKMGEGPSPEMEKEEMDTAKEGCLMACEEIISALDAKDKEKLFEALKSFIDCYQDLEEVEEPSEEE